VTAVGGFTSKFRGRSQIQDFILQGSYRRRYRVVTSTKTMV